MAYQGNPNYGNPYAQQTYQLSPNMGYGAQQIAGALAPQYNTTGVPYMNLNSTPTNYQQGQSAMAYESPGSVTIPGGNTDWAAGYDNTGSVTPTANPFQNAPAGVGYVPQSYRTPSMRGGGPQYGYNPTVTAPGAPTPRPMAPPVDTTPQYNPSSTAGWAQNSFGGYTNPTTGMTHYSNDDVQRMQGGGMHWGGGSRFGGSGGGNPWGGDMSHRQQSGYNAPQPRPRPQMGGGGGFGQPRQQYGFQRRG